MTIGNAGYLGYTKTPTISDAKGVWSSREQLRAKKGLIWPSLGGLDANTKMLYHFDGGLTDSSGNSLTLTANGGIATSATQFKFGSQALAMGSGKYATISTAHATIGAVSGNVNDWTLDFWVYTPDGVVQIECADSTFAGYLIYNGTLYASSDNANWNISSARSFGTMQANQWQHWALVRSGSTWYIFLDGVIGDTWTSSLTPMAGGILQIGRSQGGAGYMSAGSYIDEVRVSRYARWTAAFVPPIGAYHY